MTLAPEKAELGGAWPQWDQTLSPSHLSGAGDGVSMGALAQECCPPVPNPDREESCNPGAISNLAISTSLLIRPLSSMQRNHMTSDTLYFQDQTLPLQSKDLWSAVAEQGSGSQTDVQRAYQ